MSRFATQALFACALFAVSAFAAEEDVDWLFEPAPEPGSADPARLDPPPRFPSSDRSKSAWINQGDWLFDRLSGRGLRIGDPVHIRIFKQSRELELYLQGRDGFELYRTYPICDVSGMLGPKRFEGDLQANRPSMVAFQNSL